jgi:hypothetical protein
VPNENGQEMLAGIKVRALRTRFVWRSSGLLISVAAVPTPLDPASVYLTGDEAFGIAPLAGGDRKELGRMPFPFVLAFVAATLADQRNPGVPPGPLDLTFAERWLAPPALLRMPNLLRNPLRRLIVPQAQCVVRTKRTIRWTSSSGLFRC